MLFKLPNLFKTKRNSSVSSSHSSKQLLKCTSEPDLAYHVSYPRSRSSPVAYEFTMPGHDHYSSGETLNITTSRESLNMTMPTFSTPFSPSISPPPLPLTPIPVTISQIKNDLRRSRRIRKSKVGSAFVRTGTYIRKLCKPRSLPIVPARSRCSSVPAIRPLRRSLPDLSRTISIGKN